jgi:hypothetical protein
VRLQPFRDCCNPVTPDGWKLSLRDKDSNELYNLKDDRFETRNLYHERQHASLISRLTKEIPPLAGSHKRQAQIVTNMGLARM